ncbi:MAG TPA: hypothetical protein PL070_11355 [Flavobacteriales bacterium]|nr:hypothetical protein [Flavobacteriales bacterium]
MYNKDHLDGYHGRSRSVFTNNSEYERGQRASPSGAIGGVLFGVMFLALILAAAVFVLSYMLYFGPIALVGGLLLMLAMRLWKANDIPFGEAFRASFSALVALCGRVPVMPTIATVVHTMAILPAIDLHV